MTYYSCRDLLDYFPMAQKYNPLWHNLQVKVALSSISRSLGWKLERQLLLTGKAIWVSRSCSANPGPLK